MRNGTALALCAAGGILAAIGGCAGTTGSQASPPPPSEPRVQEKYACATLNDAGRRDNCCRTMGDCCSRDMKRPRD